MAAKKPQDPLSGRRLPHGRHALSREQVAEHQRGRLMSAMIEEVGEKGYATTTVSEVSARAGVSRKAFYQHFPNKEECFLATYDETVAEGLAHVTRAYSEAEGFPDVAVSGIQALFERAISSPQALRLVLVEIGAVGAVGAARRERLIEAYEQLLRDGLGLSRGSGTIPNPVLRSVVGGLNKVLYTHVVRGAHKELRALVPDLVSWITSYYPVPEAIRTLKDPEPRLPPAGLTGGRAPGTLSPGSSTGRRRGLPRREANMSRSYVVHSQRERILDAVANLSFTRGYRAFTVDDIAEEAAVSLKAFYEHFTDKEDAFLVAYEAGHSKGLGIVERAYRAAPDWRTGIRAAIAALFDFLASEPPFAHMALVEALIATPQTAESASRGTTPYAQMLLPGLEETSAGDRPPAVTIEAIAGGVSELCFSYALQRRITELSELVPRATYFALAPFVGAEAAGRIATEPVEG
jgi:AcrR family transcriptional regulator